ncbi:hypothetical protein CPB86DRAFT_878359 [Serendipita vermifera]|nr:hypothetical protein CPB86DRAFT_878359 [Serendipita vermifera]
MRFSGILTVVTTLCGLQAIQAATITVSTTTPSATTTSLPACKTPSNAGFNLHALREDGSVYPVRLLASKTTVSSAIVNMIVSTNSSCTNCGSIPSYWTLSNKVLAPVYPPVSTINSHYLDLPVDDSTSPSFLVTSKTSPTYPIYCLEASGLPTYTSLLSVNGTPKEFTMCAYTSVVPYPTRFDIIYKTSDIKPAGLSCFPIKLVTTPLFVVDPPPLPSATLL